MAASSDQTSASAAAIEEIDEEYNEDIEHCDGCGAELEEGRIGYCDGCIEARDGEQSEYDEGETDEQ